MRWKACASRSAPTRVTASSGSRFCAPHIMSAVFFPDWIPRLHSDFRDAKFSVESDNLPECLALLDEGAADYAVALFDAGGAVARRVGLSAEGGGLRWLELGGERLVPVSAPNAAGRPLYDLARAGGQAISFLGYADECHLGWSLRPLLDGLDLDLQQSHNASLTDGLRLMALSGLGVAWLPLSLVRGDLDARKLVRAGGAAFECRCACDCCAGRPSWRSRPSGCGNTCRRWRGRRRTRRWPSWSRVEAACLTVNQPTSRLVAACSRPDPSDAARAPGHLAPRQSPQ